MAFPPEKQWNDDRRAGDASIADHTEFDVLKCLPADGHKRRYKRDSACPADGSTSSLHHIRERGHGSFWHIAADPNVCFQVRFWRLS